MLIYVQQILSFTVDHVVVCLFSTSTEFTPSSYIYLASYQVAVYDDFSNVLNYQGPPYKKTANPVAIGADCSFSVRQLERCTRIRITFLRAPENNADETDGRILGIVDLTGKYRIHGGCVMFLRRL